MIAFVLSGGGNRGALQAGAVQALLSRGIAPDILVGTSVGAINAAFLARDPSVAAALELERVWLEVTDEDVYPGSRLAILWRLVTRQAGLFPSDNFYRFLGRHMSAATETFGDLKGAATLYVVATHLETGRMHVFGEQPDDRVIDAIMASTALPPLHPPWPVDGEYYVDGGAVSDLPLRVAVDKGAETIYALHLPAPFTPLPGAIRLGDIAGRAISALVQQQIALDFDVARAGGITLHHLELRPPSHLQLSPRDFSQSEKLIALGREQAERYLETRRTQTVGRRERFMRAVRRTVGNLRDALSFTSQSKCEKRL